MDLFSKSAAASTLKNGLLTKIREAVLKKKKDFGMCTEIKVVQIKQLDFFWTGRAYHQYLIGLNERS